jgi:hypothetical protein
MKILVFLCFFLWGGPFKAIFSSKYKAPCAGFLAFGGQIPGVFCLVLHCTCTELLNTVQKRQESAPQTQEICPPSPVQKRHEYQTNWNCVIRNHLNLILSTKKYSLNCQ